MIACWADHRNKSEDLLTSSELTFSASFNHQTCFLYVQALQHGVKYIYQTMPRMLTLWLDLGESKEMKK